MDPTNINDLVLKASAASLQEGAAGGSSSSGLARRSAGGNTNRRSNGPNGPLREGAHNLEPPSSVSLSVEALNQVDAQDIVINEFLAGSDTCCGADIFDGNTEDFVELYNNGLDSININGWGFSDTDGLITTIAPDTSIAPGDFLVLWYTGDNNGFPEINEKLS